MMIDEQKQQQQQQQQQQQEHNNTESSDSGDSATATTSNKDEDVTMEDVVAQPSSNGAESMQVTHNKEAAVKSLPEEDVPPMMMDVAMITDTARSENKTLLTTSTYANNTSVAPAVPAKPTTTVTLIAKYNKERISVTDLPLSTTIQQVKDYLCQQTRILPKRQKLVGLSSKSKSVKGLPDNLTLEDLKSKTKTTTTSSSWNGGAASTVITHQFILMGTPEENIFVDPDQLDELPDVVDDLDWEYGRDSDAWLRQVAASNNLKTFTEKTLVHVMNPPRPGKPLLVLDLDHTLLDFSSKVLLQNQQIPAISVPLTPTDSSALTASMKRPYMDQFLETCYQHYDMVVWSQTSWRWLETKLIELGMLTLHSTYKFCFVLDKTSMFTIHASPDQEKKLLRRQRRLRAGNEPIQHHVKPLQIIWSKFEQWGPHNTVHVDDLARNFALNPGCGLKVKGFYRKKPDARADSVLLQLQQYLVQLATSNLPFDRVDFQNWQQVVISNRPLVPLAAQADDDDDEGDGGDNKAPSSTHGGGPKSDNNDNGTGGSSSSSSSS